MIYQINHIWIALGGFALGFLTPLALVLFFNLYDMTYGKGLPKDPRQGQSPASRFSFRLATVWRWLKPRRQTSLFAGYEPDSNGSARGRYQ